VTYISLFYIIVIFFLPCENVYDYTVPVCGASPCYQSYGILGMWEFIVNTSIPILLEGIVSIGLVVRVLWQKRRLQQSANWRKHRRMMIQLFLISGLNITLNLPISLIPLAHFCGLPPEYGVQAQLYFFFLGYFVFFLFPFASLCQFPDLRKKIKMLIINTIAKQPRHPATIAPMDR
jgi:sterol desaturase/sphingolipid hydroxylase (fatty acid hydroxylase superfamily)